MANLFRSRKDSSTPSTPISSTRGTHRSPARHPNQDLRRDSRPCARLLIVDNSGEGDEVVPSGGVGPRGDLKEAPLVKVDEGKGKVDEAPVAEESFPPLPTSRSSSIRREVERHEDTLNEMRAKWVQVVSSSIEPLDYGPVLQPHWNVTKNFFVIGSDIGRSSLELYKGIILPFDQEKLLACPMPEMEIYVANHLT
ncbi:hypothetical protein Salat_1474900 [Sesamum alatum]|uniref:Uncharacterized protein n=1 Tax=Sesamum alatum TaxID=300844 RepID=A0AAE1YBA2_9LAMI|nr:hypothetical protein Salat_1474900 [Sesamum alatum]